MITERAMLAAVHISIWTAVKHDRKVSRRSGRCNTAPPKAPGATTRNCCAERKSWMRCALLPGRSDRASTRSPCHGRMRAIDCCRRHFYFELTTADAGVRAVFAQQVEEFLVSTPATSSRFVRS